MTLNFCAESRPTKRVIIVKMNKYKTTKKRSVNAFYSKTNVQEAAMKGTALLGFLAFSATKNIIYLFIFVFFAF